MWATPKVGGSDFGDVSLVPLGSKEFHDPLTKLSGKWLRVKSLHLIMNKHKMIEMKV